LLVLGALVSERLGEDALVERLARLVRRRQCPERFGKKRSPSFGIAVAAARG
jgi:hypothetical protein